VNGQPVVFARLGNSVWLEARSGLPAPFGELAVNQKTGTCFFKFRNAGRKKDFYAAPGAPAAVAARSPYAGVATDAATAELVARFDAAFAQPHRREQTRNPTSAERAQLERVKNVLESVADLTREFFAPDAKQQLAEALSVLEFALAQKPAISLADYRALIARFPGEVAPALQAVHEAINATTLLP
jgi:hypothetical protein